jgi:hypothetical protein
VVRHNSWNHNRFFFFLKISSRQLRVCCGAPSLTRVMVCNLQLLLGIARAKFLWFHFHGTCDHIFSLSNLRLTQTWRAKFLYLFIPETDRPDLLPSNGTVYLIFILLHDMSIVLYTAYIRPLSVLAQYSRL